MGKASRKANKFHKQQMKQVQQQQDMQEIYAFTEAVSAVVRDKEMDMAEIVLRVTFGFGDKRIARFAEELEKVRGEMPVQVDPNEAMNRMRAMFGKDDQIEVNNLGHSG